MAEAAADVPHPLLDRLEEYNRLYFNNRPTAEVLAAVDKCFQLVADSVTDRCTLLRSLPPHVTDKHFLALLEVQGNREVSDIAKANIQRVEEMEMDQQTQRKVYLNMYEALAFEGLYSEDAYHFLIKYLSTFATVTEKGSVEDKACQAIINTLKLNIWQYDHIADLVPVRALAASKVPQHQQLYELFDIFCTKGYQEFSVFSGHNKAQIEKWGLDAEELTAKMRMLGLCRIAHGKSELNYTDVATALNINEGDVEGYVVKAVGKGLLAARIDQINRVVRVSYAHHVVFSHAEWLHLQETLGAWKDAVSGLVQKFDQIYATGGHDFLAEGRSH